MAKARFASVTEYIASKPRDTRGALERVRRAIRKAVPTASEELSYQKPVYMLNGVPVLYFAGWTSHYSLFPATDALVAGVTQELSKVGDQPSEDDPMTGISDPRPVHKTHEERLNAAEAEYKKVAEGDTVKGLARLGLAGILFDRGKYKEALVEYRAEDPKVPIRPEHKTSLAGLVRELGANGFVLVESDESLPEQRIVVFRPS